MTARLERYADRRGVVLAWVLTAVVLIGANIFATWFAAVHGGHGLLDFGGASNALDTPGHLTVTGVDDLLTAWGPSGRRTQLTFTLTGDVLLPLVVAVTLALTMLRGSRSLGVPARGRRALLALPLAAMIADYLENVGIVALVTAYPGRLDGVAAALGVVTHAKGLLAGVALLGALGLLATGAAGARLTASHAATSAAARPRAGSAP
ncbi:hypothetical protein [Cellulomonas sp. URHB0016]